MNIEDHSFSLNSISFIFKISLTLNINFEQRAALTDAEYEEIFSAVIDRYPPREDLSPSK